MFDFFYIPKTGEQSLLASGRWNTVVRTLKHNTEKIVDYYQQYPQVIPSSHLLVKLIYAMNVSKSVPLDRFFYYCNARAYNVAQHMGLTSAISRGKVFDGVFYGPGSYEVLIANDEYFDIDESYTNWKAFRPIRVLQHAKSDVNMNIPDGRYSSSEQGTVVLTVNIPMLMVQYYHFTKEQDIMEKAGAPRKTVMQFVYSYALTNMVYSHLDYAIFNRLCKLSRNEPVGQAFLRHSFSIAQSNDIDSSLQVAVKFLKTNSTMRTYQKFLNIPCVHADNFTDILELPKTAPTMQVYWALILSKVKALSFLLTTYSNPRTALAAELNLIQRFLKMHGVVASMRSILGSDAWNDVYEDVTLIEMV